MCANCGNATSESLPVAKVFERRGEERATRHIVVRAMVPFCPPCIAQHQIEAEPMTPLHRFFLSFHNGVMIGALCAGAAALFTGYAALRSLASPSANGILGGLAAFFGLISWGCYRFAYQESDYLAAPPLTSITSAFDFTDDRAEPFQAERRTFSLRNPAFADVFIARNVQRAWSPEAPRVRAPSQTPKLLLYLAWAVVLLWLAWKILAAVFRAQNT